MMSVSGTIPLNKVKRLNPLVDTWTADHSFVKKIDLGVFFPSSF